MGSLRNISRRPAVVAALSWLTARYIGLMAYGRWQIENGDIAAGLIKEGKPFVRILARQNADDPEYLGVFGTGHHRFHHRDGIFISRIAALGSVRSPVRPRGGGNALIAAVRAKRGEYIGIARWPRGPRMRSPARYRGQTIGRCPAAGSICSIAVPGLFLMGPICSSLSVRAGG